MATIQTNRNHAEILSVNRVNTNVKMAVALVQLKFAMASINVTRTKRMIVSDLFALKSNSNAVHRQIERHFVLTISNSVMECR